MNSGKESVPALDFEQPLLDIERKIRELQEFSRKEGFDVTGELEALDRRARDVQRDIYSRLTPWQRVALARHPNRPYTLDLVGAMAEGFVELRGDRQFRDDPALIGGVGFIGKRRVVFLGHQKGRSTRESIKRNFGCPHPEGYRKAARLMRLADKFRLPLVCLIDTPGAYPGVEAEERGQAHAIAENLRLMLGLKVPIVVVVIGEGGSGGALGIGVGDRIIILENAYYSVISPEGCAAILWKTKDKAPEAARALKLTPNELLELKIVDEVIPEPLTGAHRNWEKTAELVKEAVTASLDRLEKLPTRILVYRRQEKYRKIGIYGEK